MPSKFKKIRRRYKFRGLDSDYVSDTQQYFVLEKNEKLQKLEKDHIISELHGSRSVTPKNSQQTPLINMFKR